MKPRPGILALAAAAAVLAVTATALLTGPAPLFPWTEQSHAIFFELRLPRVVLAFLVGASLGVSGLLCQATLQNPLADPYLLGISSGATLGAVLSIGFLHGGAGLVTPMAFVGGLLGVVLTLLAAGRDRWLSPSSLLLGGAIVSFLLSALTLVLLSFTRAPDLPGFLFWISGDFSLSDFGAVRSVLATFLPALGFALLFRREIELVESGEESARALGVHTRAVMFGALLVSTLAAAAAVANVGMIGFVGLMVPHAARGLFGHRMGRSALGAALLGGAFLTLADLAARSLLPFGELPVGAMTALVGAPVFLVLLRRGRLAG